MLAKRQFVTMRYAWFVVVKCSLLPVIERVASNSDPSGCIMCKFKFENIKDYRENQTNTN